MNRANERYETDPDDGFRREVVRSWVKEKHRLLARYVDSSRSARARMQGTPCFVDLFCGPGKARIRDTNECVDGGSIVAIRNSINPSRGQAAPFERVFIADLRDENVGACKARLASFGLPISSFVGPAERTVEDVIRALPARGIHLAYLDPYALKALPFSILRAFSGVPNVDLIIHFAFGDLTRNLERSDLSNGFDSVAPGWQSPMPACGKSELRRRFFNHWERLLEDCGYYLGKRPYVVKNSKKREIYRLTVASKHPLGTKLWDSLGSGSPQLPLPMFR